jgi:hypothetical protein
MRKLRSDEITLLALTARQRRHFARCAINGIPAAELELGPLLVDTRGSGAMLHIVHDEVVYEQMHTEDGATVPVSVVYTPGGLGAAVAKTAGTYGAFLDASVLLPQTHELTDQWPLNGLVPLLPEPGVYTFSAGKHVGYQRLLPEQYPAYVTPGIPVVPRAELVLP